MTRAELDQHLHRFTPKIVPASAIRGWEPGLDPATIVIEYTLRGFGDTIHVILNADGTVQRAIPTYE